MQHQNMDFPSVLPQMTAGSVRLGNSLYTSREIRTGESAKVRWQRHAVVTRHGVTLWLKTPIGHTAMLSMDSMVFPGAQGIGPLAGMTDDDMGTYLQALCGDLLDAMEKMTGHVLDIQAVSVGRQLSDPDELQSHWCNTFIWEDCDGVRSHGQLTAEPDFWQLAAMRLRPVPNMICAANVTLRLAVTLGWSRLNLLELAQLEPGGWMLIEHHELTHNGEGRLTVRGRAAGIGFDASINEEGTITMLSELQPSEDPERAQTDWAPAPVPIPEGLLQVPIRVTFEIGELGLALGSFGNLQPGYVFELGGPASEKVVRLMVEGTEIGQGKLVLVGESLGVQLESVRAVQEQMTRHDTY
jgi:type III secretion system YscQ/HrcQ family protein